KLAKQAEAAKANPQQPVADNAAAAEPAAPAAPAQKLDKYNDAHSNAMRQFKKGFISWPKLLVILVLILIWVRSCDWINQDTQIFGFSYGKWNPIELFPFLAILLLFAFPILVGFANFWVAFVLLFVCYLACFIPYVVLRNKAVQLHQKVFTPDCSRYELAQLVGQVGIKSYHERRSE